MAEAAPGRPLHILKVTFAYPPFYEMGGPPTKIEGIARELVRRGHHVTVLTPDHSARSAASIQVRNGVEIVYLRTITRYRTSFTVNPGTLSFFRQRLQEFDVVHIYGLYDLLGPAAARACRKVGTPYVVEPLGMFPPIVRSVVKKRLYMMLAGRGTMRDATHVVATSGLEKSRIMEGGIPEGWITIRRNGVDLNDFVDLPNPGLFRRNWAIPGAARVVLFLSRLAPTKHPDMLLDAFADTPVGTYLVLAGPDQDGQRAQLEARARQLGLSDRVVFPGALYGREKVEALVDADIFVLPSESDSFGNAVGEALACGTAAIVTDRCGIAPYVNGVGGLVVPLGTEPLKTALTQLLLDTELRARFSDSGPALARSLSWDQPVDQMIEIYRRIAGLCGS